jgi:DNA invertase Pin-like site-specific DNA recombinase
MNSPFNTGDKVVAYCRYSGGEEQGLKNTSTDEQEAAIRRFCAENGLDLVKVYADPFVSGRSTKGREHYLEMMSDLIHKKVKAAGLVAWDFERIHRNYDQAQLDGARLRMAGYKIFSLMQPIMDTSPFAKVMEAMYFASAQNQSDMISADVRRALQSNFTKYKVIPRTNIPDGWIAVQVDMGTYSNGKPRTGYKAEPDPDLIPKIREGIKARMSGATMEQVKQIIGGPFAKRPREAVRLLMKKPLLHGQITFGGTIMDNYCEPIINKEEFDALQIYNSTAPKEHYKPLGHFSKNRPMLSDMLYCGVCGKKAFLDRRKAKGHIYETYYCNDYHVGFRREVLDSLVVEKGIEILSDSSYQKTVQSITEGLKTPFTGDVDNLSIEAEIAKIDRKIARISDAIEDSDEPPATLVKRLADLEKKRAEFAQMPADTDPDSADHILAEADRLRLSILSVLKNEKSTTDQLRDAFSLFIHSVVIYPDKRVLIRHTLPGFAKVAGDSRQNVFAPLCNKMPYSQLFENWYTAV